MWMHDHYNLEHGADMVTFSKKMMAGGIYHKVRQFSLFSYPLERRILLQNMARGSSTRGWVSQARWCCWRPCSRRYRRTRLVQVLSMETMRTLSVAGSSDESWW